jgi:hypothetical protein
MDRRMSAASNASASILKTGAKLMPDEIPTTDLPNRVAAAMWAIYQASPIVSKGSAGMSWDHLCELADNNPSGNAAEIIRDVGLEEAEAAIAIVKRAFNV